MTEAAQAIPVYDAAMRTQQPAPNPAGTPNRAPGRIPGGLHVDPAVANPTDDEAAVAFVRTLVEIPSLSYGERDAVEHFVRCGAAMGLTTQIDAVGNGLAWRGNPFEASNLIVLLGHIDTVPGDIPVRIEEGILHGRGSVDAKGPLAAMLLAAARAELEPTDAVLVAAATGEESAESPGANHLVRSLGATHERGLHPAACIIGEPSGWDGVTLGYKGRLVCRATIRRNMAHTAGPDASACDAVMHWWNEVRQSVDKLNQGRDGNFETIQAGVRRMESSSNGLIDLAHIDCGFRLPPWLRPNELERTLRDLLPDDGELAARGHEVAHRTDRSDPVVRALSGAIRAQAARPRPKVKTGTADLNVVGPVWRCPIAAYGPGDSSLDHTPHEHLVLDEYLRAIRVLTSAVESLAAELRERGRA